MRGWPSNSAQGPAGTPRSRPYRRGLFYCYPRVPHRCLLQLAAIEWTLGASGPTRETSHERSLGGLERALLQVLRCRRPSPRPWRPAATSAATAAPISVSAPRPRPQRSLVHAPGDAARPEPRHCSADAARARHHRQLVAHSIVFPLRRPDQHVPACFRTTAAWTPASLGRSSQRLPVAASCNRVDTRSDSWFARPAHPQRQGRYASDASPHGPRAAGTARLQRETGPSTPIAEPSKALRLARGGRRISRDNLVSRAVRQAAARPAPALRFVALRHSSL